MPSGHCIPATRIAACLLGFTALFSSAARAEDLQPFEVSYSWIWRGVTVALSSLTLAHGADDQWTYSSTNEPRGLGKLYPMRIRDFSRFGYTSVLFPELDPADDD